MLTKYKDVVKTYGKGDGMQNGIIREVVTNDNPLKVGDDFTIEYNGITFARKVKGLIESAEYKFHDIIYRAA